MYRMDRQQGLTVQHRELYSMPVKTIMEKNVKKNIQACITESLCSTAVVNTAL